MARDAELVRAVADGSEQALGILYDRHVESVFAAASRLTNDRQVAEEVVQETFLALWNRAELYDPQAGSLAAWLLTIARNRAVDRLRAAGRRPRIVPLSAAGANDEPETATLERIVAEDAALGTVGAVVGGANLGPGPEGALAAQEVRVTIRVALAAMPEPERAVIVLAYQDGLTQSEIAMRLGWPIGTVKTRTRRALAHLRETLAHEFEPLLDLDVAPMPVGES